MLKSYKLRNLNLDDNYVVWSTRLYNLIILLGLKKIFCDQRID
jgi:hypothetical protein